LPQKILNDFFTDSIKESTEKQGLDLSHFVKLYLTGLMVRLAVDGDSFYRPSIRIADLYMEALIAEAKSERRSKLKDIGDISIIKLGFFPESINKIMPSSYYRDMGIMAYGAIYEDNKNLTYKEMHDSYDVCIDVVNGIRGYAIGDDILKLYEFWETTDSKFAKGKLIKLGFFPEEGIEA